MEENNIRETSQEKPGPYLIPTSIVVAGVLIAGAVMYSNTPYRTSSSLKKETATLEQARIQESINIADDDPFLGDPNAPVVMVEFGDFQCPFCARFFRETESKIIDKYVKTGKVKFVYRDFPLTSIHSVAQKAAEAAECADEQNKFWEYHDLLYQRQQLISEENLKMWARELRLDLDKFSSCLDSGKYTDEVDKDFSDGQSLGVSGTPATFVNGRMLAGALPYEQFERIIEEELKKVK